MMGDAPGVDLAQALLDAEAANIGYVTVYRALDGRWRARVGDTTFIAEAFGELPELLRKATRWEVGRV